MTHDDVIRLARQVADPDTTDPLCGGDQRDLITLNLDEMVRFAALVAAAEREACALIIEGEACAYSEPVWVVEIVNDIRARGEEPKRHPGYIIGDHWLQAAYTRICTGETEDEVMTDYGWQRESR